MCDGWKLHIPQSTYSPDCRDKSDEDFDFCCDGNKGKYTTDVCARCSANQWMCADKK